MVSWQELTARGFDSLWLLDYIFGSVYNVNNQPSSPGRGGRLAVWLLLPDNGPHSPSWWAWCSADHTQGSTWTQFDLSVDMCLMNKSSVTIGMLLNCGVGEDS